ncbi:unnamed protein product, partial [Ectocarpus sp. 12 AP-2014]
SNPTECVARALGADKTEPGVDQVHLWRLKGVLRLFQQVAAAHATSWLWPDDTVPAAKVKRSKKSEKPEAIVRTLPVLRRRLAKPRVLLAALARYNRKLEGNFHGGDFHGNDKKDRKKRGK